MPGCSESKLMRSPDLQGSGRSNRNKSGTKVFGFGYPSNKAATIGQIFDGDCRSANIDSTDQCGLYIGVKNNKTKPKMNIYGALNVLNITPFIPCTHLGVRCQASEALQ